MEPISRFLARGMAAALRLPSLVRFGTAGGFALLVVGGVSSVLQTRFAERSREVRQEVCRDARAIHQAMEAVQGEGERFRQPPGVDVARLLSLLRQQNERLWNRGRDRYLAARFQEWQQQAAQGRDRELLQVLGRAQQSPAQDQMASLVESFVCRLVESSSPLRAEKIPSDFRTLRLAVEAYLKRANAIPKLALGFSQDLNTVCVTRNSERLFLEQEELPYAGGDSSDSRALRERARVGIDAERRAIESSFKKRWGKWLKLEELARCPRGGGGAEDPPRSLASVRRMGVPRKPLAILAQSEPLDSYPKLILSGRRSARAVRGVPQDSHDRRDSSLRSPKSARFSARGDLLYVQALEGEETAVLTAHGLGKLTGVSHRFDGSSRDLFGGLRPRVPATVREPLEFAGKPVESELTHEGRYLWVPYYRKSYDPLGRLSSALAIIDTTSHRIVRVIETGAIAKGVRGSRDGKWVAISNWGDNTVSLWNIEAESPKEFKLAGTLMVGPKVDLARVGGNRDKQCGVCVRGLSFSADSRYLWVGAMHTGEIATFDLTRLTAPLTKPVAVFSKEVPHPRDLVLTADGRWLFVSCAVSGRVYRLSTAVLIPGGHAAPDAIRFAKVAGGVRSIRLSSDGAWLFAAVHGVTEITVLDVAGSELRPVSSIKTDPFPVGLDLSPDGRWLAVTAQGLHGRGGDAATIFWVLYPAGTLNLHLGGGTEGALADFQSEEGRS